MAEGDPHGILDPTKLKIVACKAPDEITGDWRAAGGKVIHCARCQCEIVIAPRTQAYLGDPRWYIACYDCAGLLSSSMEAMGYSVAFPGVRVPEKKE